MNSEEENLGRLIEALTITSEFTEPLMPEFNGYGPNPDWWNYWGAGMTIYHLWKKSSYKDIVYRNQKYQKHRLFGPAYTSLAYNITAWYKEGKLHREGDPAYIHNNNMIWFKEGKLHNLNGPAVIEGGGPKQYWIDGVRFSKKQYKWEIARRKRKGLIK